MRRVSVLICGVVLTMIATLLLSGTASSADPSSGPTASDGTSQGDTADSGAAKQKPKKKPKKNWRVWNPKPSKIINDPTVGHRQRVIMNHVIKAIRHTRRGQVIRMAVWNFDDKRAATALVRAFRRGVQIQMLTSYGTDNKNFARIRRVIKTPKKKPAKRSFVRRCVGACRAPGKSGIMHAKFFTFSQIGNRAKNVTMFGSVNITNASGTNQWNDLITLKNPQVYRQYVKMFNRFRPDKVDRPLYRVFRTKKGDVRSSFYPANKLKVSPITRALRDVQCRGAGKGFGNGNGRTKIRIAIAGWFDEYGAKIARQVRRKWDQGCDVKIVNTLTGRGINAAIRDPRGRGPIPTREITTDPNGDGIPDKYLHLKYLTIDGKYEGNPRSAVLFTGSGNWTARASRSDELLVRLKRPKWAKYYATYVDRLYNSPWAHARQTTPATLRAATPNARSIDGKGAGLPDWDW